MIKRLLVRLLRLVRGSFRRGATQHNSVAAVGDPDSQIGRRIWALGYLPDDEERVRRIGDAERALREHLRVLHAAGHQAGDAADRRAAHVRQRVAEFLEEPGGHLAHAIRRWPPRHPGARNPLDDAITEATLLGREADEIREVLAGVAALRGEVAELERRFAGETPQMWSSFSGSGGFAEQLRHAASPAATRGLKESIDWARAALALHAERLTETERMLSSRLAPILTARQEEMGALPSQEARVQWLLDLSARVAAQIRERSTGQVEEASSAHLEHLKSRGKPRGEPVGSLSRALARWDQLRVAGDGLGKRRRR